MSAGVVELQVFSGRENPRWTLTDAEVRHLAELSARLAEPASPIPPRLGRVGFVVYAARGAGWTPWLRVADGTVTVVVGGRSRVLRDSAGVEEWLVGGAERAGLGDVLAAADPGGRSAP